MFNEETPFPCQHGKTLYFASQGHENIGGFDIFYATLQNDGTWSTPENIGYPINSTDDDMFYIPMNAGIQGYLSLADQEDAAGQKDIYFLDIFSDRNPRPVEISGVVSLAGDASSGPGTVRVTVEGPASGFSEKLVPDQQGGFKTVSTDPGSYIITAEAEGFIPEKRTVQLPADYFVAEVTANINLQPIPVAEPIVLKNVYFDHYSSVVSPQGKVNVMEVVAIMKDHPSLRIEVAGYCDNTGAEWFNKNFSMKRANSVARVLQENGIGSDRFEVQGYGEEQFLAINNYPDGRDAPEGRKFNRRVEFHVIQSDDEHIVSEKVEVPDHLKYKE
jgi:outer membrane protein OmpA-like peptidoglycan-associated protein